MHLNSASPGMRDDPKISFPGTREAENMVNRLFHHHPERPAPASTVASLLWVADASPRQAASRKALPHMCSPC